MDYADIIARIAAAINDDEVAAITGPVGNGILNDMVAELGEGYQFAGILTPTSNPVRTDARLWALAMTPGKYYNLDGRVLADGQVAVFMWGGGWSSVVLSVTTAEAVRELLSRFMDATTADAEVDLKADELTPVVPPMVTGSARGILGRSAAARFLYRQTSSGSGAAWLRSIHGRTVSYNQLVQNGDFSDGTTGWRGQYGTISASNNTCIYTMSQSASSARIETYINFVGGHKYYIAFVGNPIKSTMLNIRIQNTTGDAQTSALANAWTKCATVLTAAADGGVLYLYCNYNLSFAVGDTCQYRAAVVVDLTQAGLDSIITTPEQFEAWQMEQFGHTGYLGHTPGKLVNVNPTGVKTTGRNLFDESTLIDGKWRDASNVEQTTAGRRASDVYFPCAPLTDLYLRWGGEEIGNFNIVINFYDGDKNWLSGVAYYQNPYHTTPENAAYFRISSAQPSGTICINVSDPAFNGQYEPYNGHTLPLNFTEHFPTGFNGVNGIFDEVVSDENGKFTDGEKRFGKVDLGDLTWTYDSNQRFISSALSPAASQTPGSTFKFTNEINSYGYYDASSPIAGNVADKAMSLYNGRIYLYNSAYTDAATFKAAMNGVPLVYQLATPQHVTFTDPSDAVYPVTEGGTEQVLPVNGSEPTTIAPDFQMQAPLRRGYDTPTDATFDNFLEALGQHLGKTIAKEWDAETQTYQFDIL